MWNTPQNKGFLIMFPEYVNVVDILEQIIEKNKTGGFIFLLLKNDLVLLFGPFKIVVHAKLFTNYL